MSQLRYNVSQATGDFDSDVAGTATGMTTLFMGIDFLKIRDLSALCVVDAETDTITIAASWQGSNDGSTWVDVAHAPQNPASVVLATGTAGADAAVTKVVGAPEAIYGFQFARLILTNGVASGTTSDTYTVGYNYRQMDGVEIHD